MDSIAELQHSLKGMKRRRYEDFSDRLAGVYTVLLLIISAMVVTLLQIAGQPITCWFPPVFTLNQERFANNLCWMNNIFNRNADPAILQERPYRFSGYYLWMPLIFLAQALGALIPGALWRVLVKPSPFNPSTLLEDAYACQVAPSPELRTMALRHLVGQLECKAPQSSIVAYNRGRSTRTNSTIARWYSIVAYLLAKLAYLGNAISQLIMIDHLLMVTSQYKFGFGVVSRLLADFALGEEAVIKFDRFPYSALCIFDTRAQGTVRVYTVECSLPINAIIVKLLLVLWFWFAIVAFLTSFSIGEWLLRLICCPAQVTFVERKLRQLGTTESGRKMDIDRARVQQFVRLQLGTDGFFFIRLIGISVSEMVATEALMAMWENYEKGRPGATSAYSVDAAPAKRLQVD